MAAHGEAVLTKPSDARLGAIEREARAPVAGERLPFEVIFERDGVEELGNPRFELFIRLDADQKVGRGTRSETERVVRQANAHVRARNDLPRLVFDRDFEHGLANLFDALGGGRSPRGRGFHPGVLELRRGKRREGPCFRSSRR